MKIEYIGHKENFVYSRDDVSKEIDFSKGPVEVTEEEVTEEDAETLLSKYPKSFKSVKSAK